MKAAQEWGLLVGPGGLGLGSGGRAENCSRIPGAPAKTKGWRTHGQHLSQSKVPGQVALPLSHRSCLFEQGCLFDVSWHFWLHLRVTETQAGLC